MNQGGERVHRTWANSDRYIPRRFVSPVSAFMQAEAGSGVVMLAAAVAALVWANSPVSDSYFEILDTHLAVHLGSLEFDESILHLINDGLMAIFFFVVGLEIKRELVLGELRDPKSAALPIVAALGGMAVPAIIYAVVVGPGGQGLEGWAVPMATDIAFSVGVLSLLGRRVPSGVKLFLLALAIVDDVGGILVIAVFFTADLSLGHLAAATGGLVIVWFAIRIGIRSHAIYLPLAAIIWFLVLESGVHATVAGVALGLLTPAEPLYPIRELKQRTRVILDTYPDATNSLHERRNADSDSLELAELARESASPLARFEHRLVMWTSYLVVPLFALANAGVRFEGSILDSLTSRIALGVALGLILGKIIGISAMTWLAVRSGLARLPPGAEWRHIVGVSATAGIGFTVALFITALAFSNQTLADQAKVGIFAGSIVAGLLGTAILRTMKSDGSDRPATADEEIAVT